MVPPQIPTTDDAVRAFQKASGKQNVLTPPFGSAKAWLAHLHLLEHVISLGLETVLIMEDDVDWDVDLRSRQMELVVNNVRNFTGVRSDDLLTISPYGDAWDVLWLGHCGAEMRPVPSSPAPGWASFRCRISMPCVSTAPGAIGYGKQSGGEARAGHCPPMACVWFRTAGLSAPGPTPFLGAASTRSWHGWPRAMTSHSISASSTRAMKVSSIASPSCLVSSHRTRRPGNLDTSVLFG